jgi:hypothetical protein
MQEKPKTLLSLISWQSLFIQTMTIKRVHVGCSTQLCLTIQIEEVFFDSPQKLGCLIHIMFK